MPKWTIALGLLLFGVGCSATNDAGGAGGAPMAAGGSGGEANNPGTGGRGPVGCGQAVDVVFVMDVSASMGDFLQKLASEMGVVDQAVKSLNLGVPPHYGLVVFVDDVMVVNGGQPYQDIAPLQQEFTSWAQFSSYETQIDGVTPSFSATENSLDAIYRAATEFAWRPMESTLRVIVHTTDDSFWQGPTTVPEGLPAVHNYAETGTLLQQQHIRQFTFASFVGGDEGNEDVSAGWFGPYQGMPDLPGATGGTVFELQAVLAGQASLSASLNGAVGGAFCQPYPTPE
jgi:hypothetical protein